MKPPPPPIVSIRYRVPGASVLSPHLIPAELVISTNSTGRGSLLAVCQDLFLAVVPVTQIIEMSEAIRKSLMENTSCLTRCVPKENCWPENRPDPDLRSQSFNGTSNKV